MRVMEYSNDSTQNKNYFDRWMISASILLIILLSAILYSNQVSTFLFGKQNEDTHRPLVAQVSEIKNDVRYKFADTFSWLDAEKKQNIRLGDALFTGAGSESNVLFRNGDLMTIGEKSIVLFSQIEGADVPQLHQGEIKITINGKRKFLLNGQVTEFQGKNSRIQIHFDEKKFPKVKLLTGSVTTIHEGLKKPISLIPERELILDLPEAPQPRKVASNETIPEPKKVTQLESEVDQVFYNYNFKLYDIYENENQTLKKRKELPIAVNIKIPLHWRVQGSIDKVYGQISNEENFSQLIQTFETIGSDYEAQKIFIGDNYWRVSTDQKNWGTINRFNLIADFVPYPPPSIKIESENGVLYRLKDDFEIRGKLESSSETLHFVIEYSQDPNFGTEQTQVIWQPEMNFKLPYNSLGPVYLRARGLNSQNELTHYSPVTQVFIKSPELPQAPTLTLNEYKRYVNEPLLVSWTSSQGISTYKTEIIDSDEHIILTETGQKPSLQWTSSNPGDYRARLFSIDRWGRQSRRPSEIKIQIIPRPLILAQNENTCS